MVINGVVKRPAPRPITTVTRSISFDTETFERMETARKRLKLDRSQFVREALQNIFDRETLAARSELFRAR